jgi:WD40 repeat protein
VAFSPDGRRLASADGNGQLFVWDWASGTAQISWDKGSQRGLFLNLRFSPDGTTLLSRSNLGECRLWDLSSGQAKSGPDSLRGPVVEDAFSPDGKLLALASAINDTPILGGLFSFVSIKDDVVLNVSSEITIWDLAAGQAKATLKDLPSKVTGLVFSPDGTVLCWAATGGPAMPLGKGKEGTPIHFQFADRAGQLGVVEVATGKDRWRKDEPGGFWGLSLSADGAALAVGAGQFGGIRVFDTATGQQKQPAYRGHIGPVRRLAFASEKGTLLSTSRDQTLKVWKSESVPDPITSALPSLPSPPTQVHFAPDGETVVIHYPWSILVSNVFNLTNGQTRTVDAISLVFLPDGKRAAAIDSSFFGSLSVRL